MGAAAHRRSMTRTFTAMALAAAVVTAGCSSNSDSAESQDPAALCSSLDALETSVQGLGDVTVSAEGLAALQDGLEPVKADVAQVVDDAKAQYASQADQLEQDFDQLQLVADTARTTPSAANVSAIGPALRTLADDVKALGNDVASTC
jgi:PBP1b-binding outer membrane lipoprotein LpoB